MGLHLPAGLVPTHLATVKAYKNCFRQFIRHYDEIKPRQLTRKHIDDYIVGLIRKKR